jgi:CDP-diacylglycerol--glycerol-3-phosphate 3-phosphatidyltransferase
MLFFSFDLDANKVGTWLLYISLVFSIWSAVIYIRAFVQAAYKAPPERPAR